RSDYVPFHLSASFYSSSAPRNLHSFPTRRSSDLYQAIAKAGFVPRRTPKFSCCFDDLMGAGGWDHNVDWIMTKPPAPIRSSKQRSEEHTSELQSRSDLVCRLLLEKKKKITHHVQH